MAFAHYRQGRLFYAGGCQTGLFCPVGTEGADDTFPSDWRPPMAMSRNTAAGRNQLTSPEDRGIMLLAEEPANLDNVNNALPTVQADREYTSPSGCHVKMFFRKEHDPGIRKEIARLLLTAFEQEGNDENETSHVSVQSIDEGTGR